MSDAEYALGVLIIAPKIALLRSVHAEIFMKVACLHYFIGKEKEQKIRFILALVARNLYLCNLEHPFHVANWMATNDAGLL